MTRAREIAALAVILMIARQRGLVTPEAFEYMTRARTARDAETDELTQDHAS